MGRRLLHFGAISHPCNGFHIILKHMKRVATVFLSLILIAGIVQTSSAQTTFHRAAVHNPWQAMAPITMGHSARTNVEQSSPTFIPAAKSSPLTIQTDAVSYFQDTTSGNWWLYAPILSAGPDSLGFLRFSPILYEVIDDSIGPVKIGLGNNQFETDFDTMYTRVMALRVSVPTDIRTPRLDSASITVFPIAISPRDSIRFFVAPIEDVQFFQGGNPTGIYPIPDLFASSSGGTYIAKGSIAASELTVGNLCTVTVNFGHKSLGTRKHFGICVFVDGPDFVTDTVAYQLDANLQPLPGTVTIDTDGSLGTFNGVDGPIPMRTYRGNLDAGHLLINGSSQPSLVGGISSFFIGFPEEDISTGQPTGNIFAGNLVLTTYMSGTSTAGVADGPSATENRLAHCYPNPVSMSAEIPYNLAVSGPVTLKVYNSIGEEIATVVNGLQSAGEHAATFNTSNLPNGMYYYKLQSGDFVATQNMVVNK